MASRRRKRLRPTVDRPTQALLKRWAGRQELAQELLETSRFLELCAQDLTEALKKADRLRGPLKERIWFEVRKALEAQAKEVYGRLRWMGVGARIGKREMKRVLKQTPTGWTE